MKNLQLVLINAGLALVISGLIFGLYYSTQTDNSATLELKDAYETTFIQIVNEQETDNWRSTFEKTLTRNTWNSRAIDVHTHSINMGILVMLFVQQLMDRHVRFCYAHYFDNWLPGK